MGDTIMCKLDFIYNGWYYPVIGNSNGWVNGSTKQLCEHRVFGWMSRFGFSVGIKCRLSNPDRPYKQRVVDAVLAHPDFKITTRYYGTDSPDEISWPVPGGYTMYLVETLTDMYVGDIRDGYNLIEFSDFRSYGEHSNTVCHAWHKGRQKAYGWSHRAMVGFGVGDCIFTEVDSDGKPFPDTTPYIKHGRVIIQNKADAMKSALAFAESVS